MCKDRQLTKTCNGEDTLLRDTQPVAYDSGGDSDRERDVNDEFFDREEELRGYNRQVWPLTHSPSVFLFP